MEAGMPMNGGRFDFDDGGTYCGGWEDGKAHGHGVCTGPKGQGEYSGAWHYGFEVSGIYTWPSGNTYEGQWQNGKRHGLGLEKRGRWLYRGEWSQGYKGRYGMRQSTNSQAKFEGTWSSGLQDGYGTETYADGGTFEGQWLRGMRHGYGIRKSAQYGMAAKYRSRSHAHASLTSLRSEQGEEGETPPSKDRKGAVGDESRGGFVLRAHSEPPVRRRSLSERSIAVKRTILQGLRIKKQRSTGDIHARVTSGTGSIRSSGSTASCTSDESAFGGDGEGGHASLAQEEFLDPATTETYMGEWKNDKRSGFGISERSDGLKYEGEWFSNKKFGYGATTHKDGTREEGKYKNNILVTSQRKKHLLFVRSSKLRERIDAATKGANRAAQIALQKADIAISRTSTARDRAEQADYSSGQAKEDSDVARLHAKEFDPTFRQPGTEILRKLRQQENHYPSASSLQYSAGPSQPASFDSQHLPPVLPPAATLPVASPPDSATLSPDLSPPMLTPPSELDSPEGPAPLGTPPVPSEAALIHAAPEAASSSHEALPPEERPPPPTPPAPSAAPSAASARIRPRTASANSQPSPPAPATLDATIATESPYHHNLASQSSSPRVPHVEFADAAGAKRRARGDRSTERPTTSGRPARSQSHDQHIVARGSLTQTLTDDHFDQYALAGNPYAAKLAAASRANKRAATSRAPPPPAALAPDEEEAPAAPSPVRLTASAMPLGHMTIVRRSTLATAQDWRGLADSMEAPVPSTSSATPEEPHGSLPNLQILDTNPVMMTREVASRLSSQRRQELQRIQEEDELLQANPLRYLFHPAVKGWFGRWKLPLLVLLVNLCLSIIFYNLLTYHSSDSTDED